MINVHPIDDCQIEVLSPQWADDTAACEGITRPESFSPTTDVGVFCVGTSHPFKARLVLDGSIDIRSVLELQSSP